MSKKANARAEKLQRMVVGRSQVERSQIAQRPVEDGVLVLLDRTLTHPLYGDIRIVVDETMQENIELYTNSLRALRKVPMQIYPEAAIPASDPFVRWYTARGLPLDHARRMAASAWSIEDQEAANSAGILALFAYIDFSGDTPADTEWQTAETRARYDLPPRPERLVSFETERRLSFIKDLIRSGGATDEKDEDGNPIPSFRAQLLQVISDLNDKATAVGADEEPVDDAGFQGEPPDGDISSPDDAGGEASE